MRAETASTPSARVNWRWVYMALATGLLAAPLVAMQFTGEVQWGPGDFVVFAAMLTGLGLLLEGASRISTSLRQRIVLMGGAVLLFLIVWAELAVGLFD